jgi:DNA-binding LytR/AlgR family response regulator
MVNGKVHTVRATLNEYIGKLSKNFLRIHRSYIVNLDLLESIDYTSVVVSEQEIPVGKKHREDLLARVNLG